MIFGGSRDERDSGQQAKSTCYLSFGMLYNTKALWGAKYCHLTPKILGNLHQVVVDFRPSSDINFASPV
jgi:hypothetical protein